METTMAAATTVLPACAAVLRAGPSADGKTCQFESGKAQVTCSAAGAEIKIAKCAVPGVDPSAITLTNECVAIEDSGNADFWRISTGFQECGSTFDFNSDVEK